MSRAKSVLQVAVATTALTAMGLLAASPASAHTNNMYTYVYYTGDDAHSAFATYGKSDGVATKLPTELPYDGHVVWDLEVAAEKGTSLETIGGALSVGTWDHTTGARGPLVPLSINTIFDGATGLDSLNNGTVVTIAEYRVQLPDTTYAPHTAVAAVDSATGVLTPLTNIESGLTQGFEFYDPTSLATDPVSGTTYIFLLNDDGAPYFLAVDVATNTIGVPTAFGGLGDGTIEGADFDPADGSLYFNFDADDSSTRQLLKLGGPSTWPTAAPTVISNAPSNDATISTTALTIEYTALAATGSDAPLAVMLTVGLVAVLAGGTTLMVARRRAQAGTV